MENRAFDCQLCLADALSRRSHGSGAVTARCINMVGLVQSKPPPPCCTEDFPLATVQASSPSPKQIRNGDPLSNLLPSPWGFLSPSGSTIQGAPTGRPRCGPSQFSFHLPSPPLPPRTNASKRVHCAICMQALFCRQPPPCQSSGSGRTASVNRREDVF